MKKTVGLLCGLTILSACGTSLDFWSGDKSLVDAPRSAPKLNGTPQGGPVSFDHNVDKQLKKTVDVAKASPAQMPVIKSPSTVRNVLVPAPVFNQTATAQMPTQPVVMAANSSLPNNRRAPGNFTTADGKASADLLGPAPAPAVNRTPLSAEAPVAPTAIYEAPVVPTQKLQSVALNMPQGVVIPAAPAKDAKPLINVPTKEVAKDEAPAKPKAVSKVLIAEAKADAKAQAKKEAEQKKLELAEEKAKATEEKKAALAAAQEKKKADLAAKAEEKKAELAAKQEAKKAELETAQAEIYDTPKLQSVSENMPSGNFFPPVPKNVPPAPVPPVEMTEVKPAPKKVEQVEERVPEGPTTIVSAEDVKPAPVAGVKKEEMKIAKAEPEIFDTPPLQSVSENMPQGNFFPPVPKSMPVEVVAATPVQQPVASKNDSEPKLIAQATDSNIPSPVIIDEKTSTTMAAEKPPIEIKKIEQKTIAATEDLNSKALEVNKTEPTTTVAQIDQTPKPAFNDITNLLPAPTVVEQKVAAAPVEPVKVASLAPAPIAPAPAPTPEPAPAPIIIAEKPAEVKKVIEEKKSIVVAENTAKREYPNLASMPPAPPAPTPASEDPRVREMQEELKRAQQEIQADSKPVTAVETKTVTQVEKKEVAQVLPKPTPAPASAAIQEPNITPAPAPKVIATPAPTIIEPKADAKPAAIAAVATPEPSPAPAPLPPARTLAALPELPPVRSAGELPPISSATGTEIAMATPERPLTSAPIAKTQPVASTPAPAPKSEGLTPKGPTYVVSADDSEPVAKTQSDVTASPSPEVKSAPVPAAAPEVLPNVVQAQPKTPAAAPAPQIVTPIAPAPAATPAPVVTASPVYSTASTPAPNPEQAVPVTRAAPPAFLVPPVQTATSSAEQPAFVPMHQGASSSQASQVYDTPIGSVQPASSEHRGVLAPSRYERLRQGQR